MSFDPTLGLVPGLLGYAIGQALTPDQQPQYVPATQPVAHPNPYEGYSAQLNALQPGSGNMSAATSLWPTQQSFSGANLPPATPSVAPPAGVDTSVVTPNAPAWDPSYGYGTRGFTPQLAANPYTPYLNQQSAGSGAMPSFAGATPTTYPGETTPAPLNVHPGASNPYANFDFSKLSYNPNPPPGTPQAPPPVRMPAATAPAAATPTTSAATTPAVTTPAVTTPATTPAAAPGPTPATGLPPGVSAGTYATWVARGWAPPLSGAAPAPTPAAPAPTPTGTPQYTPPINDIQRGPNPEWVGQMRPEVPASDGNGGSSVPGLLGGGTTLSGSPAPISSSASWDSSYGSNTRGAPTSAPAGTPASTPGTTSIAGSLSYGNASDVRSPDANSPSYQGLIDGISQSFANEPSYSFSDPSSADTAGSPYGGVGGVASSDLPGSYGQFGGLGATMPGGSQNAPGFGAGITTGAETPSSPYGGIGDVRGALSQNDPSLFGGSPYGALGVGNSGWSSATPGQVAPAGTYGKVTDRVQPGSTQSQSMDPGANSAAYGNMIGDISQSFANEPSYSLADMQSGAVSADGMSARTGSDPGSRSDSFQGMVSDLGNSIAHEWDGFGGFSDIGGGGDGSGDGSGDGGDGGGDGRDGGGDGGGFRRGGMVGSPTANPRPVKGLLHTGEYVIRPEAVNALPPGLLDHINAMGQQSPQVENALRTQTIKAVRAQKR